MFEFCADEMAARGYWAIDGIGYGWGGCSIVMTSKRYDGFGICYCFDLRGFGLGKDYQHAWP